MTQPNTRPSTHFTAILQALLVTFLWSTSWILIKIGLRDIPALTFAGLRYLLAFLILLPILLRSRQAPVLNKLSKDQWVRLFLLGIVYYTVTHGAQFMSIAYLPAVTANLILGFTPVVVSLFSTLLLAERTTTLQWIGICIAMIGLTSYFYPVTLPTGALIGLAAAIIGMVANASSAIMGRAINRTKSLSPLLVTTISMGIGAALLLLIALLAEGLPTLTMSSGLIVFWLAVVNTAFAFTLWNHTLQTLSAVESSLINTTMAIQIPILAVLFLQETLTPWEMLGLVIAITGIMIVQFAGRQTAKRQSGSKLK
ncbi:MAG: DMT family transporter [Caldilineaceae bacterium]